MDVVLNEHTETIHKHETGAPELHTVCGATYNLDPDQLRRIPAEQADTDSNTTRCGRCFEDAGGY